MKQLTCQKCKHTWETKSKLIWVTCPSCQLKVKNILKDKQTKNTNRG